MAILGDRYLLVWGEDGVVAFRLSTPGTFTNKGVGPYDHKPTEAEINAAIDLGVKFPQWNEVEWADDHAIASDDALFAREMMARLSEAEENMSAELTRGEIKFGAAAVAVAILLGTLFGVFVKGEWPFDIFGTFVLVLALCGLVWIYRHEP